MNRRNMHVWVIVASMAWLLVGGGAAAQESRLPVERVMRDIQARRAYFGLELYDWPRCCGQGGTGPDYPPDGYYGDEHNEPDPECMAGLVAATVVATLEIAHLFLKVEDVAGITSTALEPENYDPAEDFPILGAYSATGAVTVLNYTVVFSDVEKIVALLKYVRALGGFQQIDGRGQAAGAEYVEAPTCGEVQAMLVAILESEWGEDWKPNADQVITSDGIQRCPKLLGEGWAGGAGLAAYRGRGLYNGGYTPYAGTAKVYFITVPLEGGLGSQTPPDGLSASGLFSLYRNIEDTTLSYQAQFPGDWINNNDAMPVLTKQCEDTSCCADPPPPCVFGWRIIATLCIAEPDFDHAPDTAAPCTYDPELPQDRDGSPGENDDGTGDGCDGSQAEGADAGDAEEHADSKSHPDDPDPVIMTTGHKRERETDVVVRLPGRDFTITRENTSKPDYFSDDFGLVGANWSLSCFRRLRESGSGSSLTVTLSEPSMHAQVIYRKVSSNPDVWRPSGPGTRVMTQATVTIDSVQHNVWRLEEPGQWQADFYRAPMASGVSSAFEGRLLQERDVYGNTWTYSWREYIAANSKLTARLMSINLADQGAADRAIVNFKYYIGENTSAALNGRVNSIMVIPLGSGGGTIRPLVVSYLYMEAGESPPGITFGSADNDAFNSDLGTDGDLIQVTKWSAVDRVETGIGYGPQGVGDGNLTLSRQHTGETGSLAAAQRDTVRTFDFRNRLQKVQRPTAPHEFTVYDNLDRPIERGLFETVPSGIGGSTAIGRGLYVKSHFSQRGLLYRQRVAINAADLSAGYLESHVWFDSEGRAITEWGPNSSAAKRVYDAHGRAVAVYTTDRAGDAEPGASGNYADALSLSGDRVLEQMSYTYNAEDRLTLTSVLRRLHDSTATGALGSSTAVATHVGFVYDAADRHAATINYGTNLAGNSLFQSGGSALTFDAAGNLRDAPKTSGGSTDRYTHDAWNRLVRHRVSGSGGVDVAEHEYDALHRRVVRRVLPGTAEAVQERRLYYDASWRLVQEEVDESYNTDPDIDRICQEVWGLRYIDEAVLRRQYASGSPEATDLHYHATDVQHSTVAMFGTGSSPHLFERVRYSPYGSATHRRWPSPPRSRSSPAPPPTGSSSSAGRPRAATGRRPGRPATS